MRRWMVYPVAVLMGLAVAVATLHVDYRLLAALALIFTGLVTVFRWPNLTMLVVLGWLAVQGLVRRLLIPVSGWQSQDPLLLFAPCVVLLFCAVHPVLRRPWNRLTQMVAVVTAVSLVEAINPAGPGLTANLAGGLFITIPLLWFFIGRTIDEKTVDWLLQALPVGALLFLGYGLRQVFVGFLPWDAQWIQQAGYTALHVRGVIRPFGTFDSSAEYEAFLLVAAVLAFARFLRAKGISRFLLGLIAVALWAGGFLDGSRGGMVLSVAAAGLLWAYRREAGRGWRLLATGALVAAGYVLLVLGHHFGTVPASGAVSTLIAHQTKGLTQPFNSKDSTLLVHVQMLRNGLVSGFKHPLGEGLGSVTLAGIRFGNLSQSYEVDFANMFQAGGLVGGAAYLAVVVTVLYRALTLRARRFAAVALPGIVITVFMQWLNGGLYFLAPFVWLTIGNVLGKGGDPRPEPPPNG